MLSFRSIVKINKLDIFIFIFTLRKKENYNNYNNTSYGQNIMDGLDFCELKHVDIYV